MPCRRARFQLPGARFSTSPKTRWNSAWDCMASRASAAAGCSPRMRPPPRWQPASFRICQWTGMAILNGLGATPLSELFTVFRAVHKQPPSSKPCDASGRFWLRRKHRPWCSDDEGQRRAGCPRSSPCPGSRRRRDRLERGPAVGDGDHGITMRLGFDAVRLRMEAGDDMTTIAAVLEESGKTFLGATAGRSASSWPGCRCEAARRCAM